MLENLTTLRLGSPCGMIRTDSSFYQQYEQLFASIVADAKQHDFYVQALSFHLSTVKMGLGIQYSIYHEEGWGWALVKDNSEEFVEPAFVFVYPHQRRKGWFSALVARLEQLEKPSFTVCTRKEPMIRALHKLGFHLDPLNPFANGTDGGEPAFVFEK